MLARLTLLLAVSSATAFVTTPGFLGSRVGSVASVSRSSDASLRLRSSNTGVARLPRFESISMMAAKKKSVSDLSRKELEGKKVNPISPDATWR